MDRVNKSSHSLIDPSERMRVVQNGTLVEISKTIPAIKYFRSGVEMARMAKIYENEGNLEKAYVLYVKYITLFLEKIRKHPDYATVPDSEKMSARKNVEEMFPKAEKLKAVLLDRYSKEYELHKQKQEEEEKAGKISIPDSLPEFTTPPWQPHRDGLRTINVPNSLISTFVKLARDNTARNVETCALLTGTLNHDRLTITVLLLPKQTGTSDDCTAEDDLGTFNVIESKNLITLGWIHTHPSQNAFLSSVDMHSQFGYQSMLPEAIAIVCAPKHSNETFKLSNMGLDVIRNCSSRGFHPHPGPSLFEKAVHAKFTDMPLETIDLR